MREIKFRAWDKEKKELWSWEDMALVTFIGVTQDPRMTLMQYTGLKDKNGKEIYEGDIVSGYANPSVVVIEPDIGFGTRLPNKLWNGLLKTWINSSVGCEVIGNIYENPELLKEPRDE